MTDEEALERIGLDPLLDVPAAAEAVGVSHWTVRQWINRGHLKPAPGVRPIMVFQSDLFDCKTERGGEKQAQRVAALASDWRAVQ